MMNNDMGLQISGRWINRMTGDVVMVTNTVEDGDTMMIVTDKGVINLNEFQNYIQASDDIYDELGNVVGHEQYNIKPMQQQTYDMGDLKPDTDIYVKHQQNSHTRSEVKVEQRNSTYDMIDKIFTTDNILLNIDVNIQSDNFPTAELAMLKKFFNITDDDIANYIRDKFMSNELINDAIEKYIQKL